MGTMPPQHRQATVPQALPKPMTWRIRGGDAIIQHNIPLDPNVIMLEYHTETYSDCQSALVVVTELTAKPSIDFVGMPAGLKRSTQEQAHEHSV